MLFRSIGRILSASNLPMVGIQDTDEHLRRRKAWQRGMSPAAIREYEHFVARRAGQLIARLEQKSQEQEGAGKEKKAIDVGTWFNYFTCVRSPSSLGLHAQTPGPKRPSAECGNGDRMLMAETVQVRLHVRHGLWRRLGAARGGPRRGERLGAARRRDVVRPLSLPVSFRYNTYMLPLY